MKLSPSFHYITEYLKSQYKKAKSGRKLGVLAVLLVILTSICLTSTNCAMAVDRTEVKLINIKKVRNSTNANQFYISQYNKFYFKDYQVDFYLSKTDDGASKMRVREEYTAIFPSADLNHGFNREIPFTNNAGKNLTMASDKSINIGVTRNGKPEPINDVSVKNNAFVVQIGDPDVYVHGEQVYVLEYEFVNVITDFGEYQELYWDTNGTDSQQRYQEVTARLHFEDDVATAYDNQRWCYVGKYGSSNESDCTVRTISDGLEFSASNLAAHENLTFDVQFKPDSFVIPEPQPVYWGVVLIGAEIIWLGVMVLSMVWGAKKVQEKRKFYKDYFVKPEYTAPKDVTVMEAESSYMSIVAANVKVATLLELAVNHKIELIDATPEGKRKKVWHVKVLSDDLTFDQRKVLEILADTRKITVGQEIKIKKFQYQERKLALQLERELQRELKAQLKEDGYTDPNNDGKISPSEISLILGMAGGVGFFTASMFVLTDLAEKLYAPLYGGTTLPILGCTIAIFGFILGISNLLTIAKYEKRTKKALELSRYLDGLKLYIGMAEAERLQVLQSVEGADISHQGVVKLYEKLLPYAMIFGQEKTWLKELSKYYAYDDVTDPSWYRGVGAFTAISFINDMNAISSSATTSFVSSTGTSSSGSSGGGGGGFSGGGGGGGGTSGW